MAYIHRLVTVVTVPAWTAFAWSMALSDSAGAERSTNALIDGVVSRAAAIHSIQLSYTHHGYWLSDNQASEETTFDAQMTVDGNNWIMRDKDSPNFRMQRGQALVAFVEINSRQLNQIFRTLYVEAPKTLQDLIDENAHNAVTRLGGLWNELQTQFIDRNRQKVVVRGERQVEGIATTVLEWPVASVDFDDALQTIPDGIARNRHGRLRICVAPELGYALPKIEYVTDEDEVEYDVTTTDFMNLGGNIFFPRRGSAAFKTSQGHLVNTFVVHEVTKLNQSLPDDTFSMKIPLGTRVSDSRPGVPHSWFDLENQEQLETLNRVLSVPDTQWWGSRQRLLLVVNSACFLICLSIYLVQRCQRKS